MSEVIYNGVSLPWPFYTRFNQEAVYDQSPSGGNTDWIGTKYDIEIMATVNFNYLGMLCSELQNADGTPKTTNPVDIIRIIKWKLLQPRRSLSILYNGQELIPVTQQGMARANSPSDSDNGPKPQSVNITQMTEALFLIQFHVIAMYWEKPLIVEANGQLTIKNAAGSPALFNRWTESVEIDVCDFSIWEREGQVRLRTDNTQGWALNDIKPLFANIGIHKGFIRENRTYRATADGLTLEYKIRDKEVYRMPPSFANRAEGEVSEQVSRNGACRHLIVRVKLYGTKYIQKAQLATRAIAICATKMKQDAIGQGALGQVKGGEHMIDQFRITYGLYDNWVEAYLYARCVSGAVTAAGAVFIANAFDTPFSEGTQDGDTTQNLAFGGSANLMLQAAAYYDPSFADARLQPPGNITMNRGQLPGQEARNRKPANTLDGGLNIIVPDP